MNPYKDEDYDNARFTTKPLKPLTDQGGGIQVGFKIFNHRAHFTR